MPKADDMVYLKKYQKGLAASFVIYAEFEANFMAINQMMINHILNRIKSIKTVDMDIRLSVAMTINIVSQFRYIEEKMLLLSS